MRNRLAYAGTMLAMMGIAGCGDDGVAKNDIDETFADATCEQIRRCPGASEMALILGAFDDQSALSCEELLDRVGAVSPPNELQGVDEGTIRYNGGRARSCLDFLIRTCVPLEEVQAFDVCRGIFTGTLDAGATCRASSECAPGNYCANENQCAGTCTPQVALGNPCTTSDACLPADGADMQCNVTLSNPVPHCRQRVITSNVALGGDCGYLGESGDTITSAYCGRGLYCRFTDDQRGVCAEPIALGQTCEQGDVCVDGFCGDGTCRQVTLQTSAGQPCDFEQGIICDGTQHLACSDGGLCETIGDGTQGSPCESDSDDLFSGITCNRGLYCDRSLDTPSCQPKKTIGAMCDDDSDCESNNCDNDTCRGPTLCTPGGGF